MGHCRDGQALRDCSMCPITITDAPIETTPRKREIDGLHALINQLVGYKEQSIDSHLTSAWLADHRSGACKLMFFSHATLITASMPVGRRLLVLS